MNMVVPDVLQVVGLLGVSILLVGALAARQWVAATASIAAIVYIVFGSLLVLPHAYAWIPTLACIVFVVSGVERLAAELTHSAKLRLHF